MARPPDGVGADQVPPADAPPTSTRSGAHPLAGDIVGPHRLLREIGHGGMGSVWEAERLDGVLRRKVALKLPRLAWDAGLAERMGRERDIAARLEHAHIARLYDAGVDERGRPWLAFEHIQGVRIDQWCVQQGLATRARLRLFLQVAQAVAYAHARLVVHRDLKPSNVLVSADGRAHLLDFGIAKLLREAQGEETGLTQQLGAALTPAYASPEQRRGEPVTVASDVYSLGVLLYELLTGQSPHPAAAASAMPAAPEAVGEGMESAPASRRMPALRGDIDAILAKALRQDPVQRYATVDAFATDIRRHLDGIPVQARPATVGYRLRKFVSRSKTALVLGIAVAGAVLGALGLSLVQAQRANAAAARASAVKEFVLDTFRVDPAGGWDGVDQRRSPRRYLLQRGAELIDARFDGQPQLQAELHGVVASLFAEMGDFVLAERHAARRLDVLVESDAAPLEKAAAAMDLSQARLRLGRAADSEEPAVRAVAWAQDDERLEIAARLQLVSALAAQDKAAPLRAELDRVDRRVAALPQPGIESALALNAHASLATLEGRPDLAIERAERAVAIATTVQGSSSREALDLRWTLLRMAIFQRHVALARDVGTSLVADLRQLGGPRDSTAAFVEMDMTAFLFADDAGHVMDFQATRALLLADREIVQLRGCPGMADADAWSDYFLGDVLATWQDFDAAQPALESAVARLPRAGEERALVPYAARTLAWTRIVRGDMAQGDAMLERQLHALPARFATVARELGEMLAFSADMQGRPDAGASRLAAAWPEERAGDPERAALRARLLLDAGRPSAALAAWPPGPGGAGAGEPAGADVRGEALCALGAFEEGQAVLRRDLAWRSVQRSPASPFTARERAVLGACLLASGQATDAAALAAQSRRTVATLGAVALYFVAPLDALEKALATQEHRPRRPR